MAQNAKKFSDIVVAWSEKKSSAGPAGPAVPRSATHPQIVPPSVPPTPPSKWANLVKSWIPEQPKKIVKQVVKYVPVHVSHITPRKVFRKPFQQKKEKSKLIPKILEPVNEEKFISPSDDSDLRNIMLEKQKAQTKTFNDAIMKKTNLDEKSIKTKALSDIINAINSPFPPVISDIICNFMSEFEVHSLLRQIYCPFNMERILSDICMMAKEIFKAKFKKMDKFYGPIRIEELHQYIDGAVKQTNIFVDSSGYGHGKRYTIAQFQYMEKKYFIYWVYRSGSCPHCDSDEYLSDQIHSSKQSTIFKLLMDDLNKKIVRGIMCENLDNLLYMIFFMDTYLWNEIISELKGIPYVEPSQNFLDCIQQNDDNDD
ncbi:MAG: hypothetical protein Edafosvirus22_15 [Edafosvirus sp.]|uniref:Uncharacterized protein n=1 Tax=Edafosvirus sp. TaxID=2487765 RepID=A0A3G4ZUS8_9VIRU|nr:MAG: hypothetical protein Edafosvirus22_15 [Edafosvirus sp.]